MAILLILTCKGEARAQAEGFQLVVNAAHPLVSISADEASKLFLKKATIWSYGAAAVAVDQPARAVSACLVQQEGAPAIGLCSGDVLAPADLRGQGRAAGGERRRRGGAGFRAREPERGGLRLGRRGAGRRRQAPRTSVARSTAIGFHSQSRSWATIIHAFDSSRSARGNRTGATNSTQASDSARAFSSRRRPSRNRRM
jgi:hypothetical protein